MHEWHVRDAGLYPTDCRKARSSSVCCKTQPPWLITMHIALMTDFVYQEKGVEVAVHEILGSPPQLGSARPAPSAGIVWFEQDLISVYSPDPIEKGWRNVLNKPDVGVI